MEFVVLLSVLAITLTQAIARPADTKDSSETKNGSAENADDFETFRFKLPTVLRHDLVITIKGTLNLSEENFTAVMPINKENSILPCTLNFNYINNATLEVFPAYYEEDKTQNYIIEYADTEKPEFVLILTAREVSKGNKMLEMIFEALSSGPSPIMSCKIESFEDLDHIHFKEGVKSIDSILFTF